MTQKVKVISEEDLLKSIQELESDAEKTPTKPQPPTVEKVELKKSTADSLREQATGATKRALDVSDVLTDLVGLMGKHNDDALTTLQKSINAGAERDLAIVKVLVDLKKSVEVLTDRIETYGQEPRRPRSRLSKDDVLEKSTDGGPVKLDPRTAKRQITQGLEILAKSLAPTDPKYMDVQQAAIRFEATGVIDDRYIAAAQKALSAPAV